MIVIIDYGVGNLTSIKKMVKKAGADATISSDAEVISRASKFILPGIGSFDHGVTNLKSSSYFGILERKVLEEKIPILGVCLGAQLLMKSSEEGVLPGLGWIQGDVTKFDMNRISAEGLKVPHMGWSEIVVKKNSLLFKDMFLNPRFYFVHSYHLNCSDASDELATAVYGYEFTCALARDNIMGVQFHPEKSHKFGMRTYENFVKYF